MKPGNGSLRANSFVYEMGLTLARRRLEQDLEAGLSLLGRTAYWACLHHPGRFADGALENMVLALGGALPNVTVERGQRRKVGSGKKRSLHVASLLYGVGGHTRVLLKWIQRDTDSEHDVVLTNQRQAIPEFVRQGIAERGGSIEVLDAAETIVQRAGALRQIARHYDRIILHTHAEDLIPVLAFALPDGPPVVMFNHAHFSFGVGTTVADLVVNTFPYFSRISRERRFARQLHVLPLMCGVAPMNLEPVDKPEARRQLGLAPDCPVILSIAQEHYYQPAGGRDFFRTAAQILQAAQNAHLLLVGVRSDSSLVPPELKASGRLHLAGPVENPRVYYQASDLCLESFPKPSLGALVEAVVYGEAFPVPVFGPGESILRIHQTPILNFPRRPTTEAEYVDYVLQLLRQRPAIQTEARQLRKSMVEFEQGWSQRLSELNRIADGLEHRPAEISVAPMATTSDDFDLANLGATDVGEGIDAFAPFLAAPGWHLQACRNGLQDRRTAVRRIWRRYFGRLTRGLGV